MAVLKCKMCGGDLEVYEGSTVAECEYCGTKQTVPVLDNEKKITLFGRANRLRFACDFDKAASVYENIIGDFPEESEAYWGLVLCKYGIEYVDDPATAKKIPTCHRSSFESVMDDGNYEQALENADSVARSVYREEAKQIENLRKGILEVSSKEQPYDIFICYKETDEKGGRTLDSVMAQDVYTALTEKGYRVFFSRITLEDKLGQEYEPYIFAALNSAKIMLVFGTDYEYFNAVWVKNEWSRFLKLIAQGQKKSLIPCYKNVDAYDMPKEFAKLQAQDMGKVGALQDLLRGIEKIVPLKEKTENAVKAADKSVNPTVDSLLKRAFMFAEDGDFTNANIYADKVLDIDPECAEAYLVKLMCGLKVKKYLELSNRESLSDFSGSNYEKLMKFVSGKLKNEVEDCYTHVAEFNYIKACKLIEALDDLSKIEQAAKIFNELGNYKDSKIKSEETTKIVSNLTDAKFKRLADCRARIKCCEGMLSAGQFHTVGLTVDGKVKLVDKYPEHGATQRNAVSHWLNIKHIYTYDHVIYGIRTDGSLITTHIGASWDLADVISVSEGVALKTDGTVVVKKNKIMQNAVSNWKDIVAVSASSSHAVGLKADGTVVAVGENFNGQCNVSNWKDIVAISAFTKCTVGLKADGTVVAVGDYGTKKCSDMYLEWNDIIAISDNGAIGLKADGTVVVRNKKIQSDISSWNDIVAVSAGGSQIVGLKADGTIVAVTDNDDERRSVTKWKLFNSIDTLEQERQEAKEKQAKLEEERKARQLAIENRKAGLNKEKSALNRELAGLGLFAFSRKKEIQTRLAQIDAELRNLK